MFPQYYTPHNYSTSANAYQFDMRLNVDFNTGHVQVNMPTHTPFAKKAVSHH